MSVLVIDKPVGPTSYDVVRRVQRALFRRLGFAKPKDLRIGHGGTLDPLASGVLPVCLGEGTKIAAFLLDADKEYEADVRFGVETDTMDAAGMVTAERPVAHLQRADVEAALVMFRGSITQVPPMYAAIKHQGRPLYEYARAGQEIVRAPRRLTIFALELLSWTTPATARLKVRCSKGTYVRVLAADLGLSLGVGAHLVGLRRTASGPFSLAQAIALDDLESQAAAGAMPARVSLSEALCHLPALVPDDAVATAVWQGKRIPFDALGLAPGARGRVRVLRSDGSLLAVADIEEGGLRSLRGFHPEFEATETPGSRLRLPDLVGSPALASAGPAEMPSDSNFRARSG